MPEKNNLSEASSAWLEQMRGTNRELMASLPPERRAAAILRIQRTLLVRLIELRARERGAILTRLQLRQDSARELEQRRHPLGQRSRFKSAQIWRRSEIELHLETLTQHIEDRIAGLSTLDAVRLCYVEGLDPPLPGAPHYVNPLHAEAEQVLQMQKRLLAALSTERQSGLIHRLARACLARAIELDQ